MRLDGARATDNDDLGHYDRRDICPVHLALRSCRVITSGPDYDVWILSFGFFSFCAATAVPTLPR